VCVFCDVAAALQHCYCNMLHTFIAKCCRRRNSFWGDGCGMWTKRL